MLAYSPSHTVLRYLRRQAGLSRAKLGELLGGVHNMQIWRWENQEHGACIPPDVWQPAASALTLGGPSEEPPLYVLAMFPKENEPDWLFDEDQRLPVFTQGEVAQAAANALTGMGLAAEALPVTPRFVADLLDDERGFFHADELDQLDSALTYVAVRAVVFDHLASITRRWAVRIQSNYAAADKAA
jgi:hypothetical protein